MKTFSVRRTHTKKVPVTDSLTKDIDFDEGGSTVFSVNLLPNNSDCMGSPTSLSSGVLGL
jgi:hypothetical protein